MVVSLNGKKALIGASSAGIGKAIAIQLAESGASVTLMARNSVKLKTVVSLLATDQGQKHDFLVVDFNDHQSFKRTVTNYFQKNVVDILVNNTQGPKAGGVLEVELDDYQNAFDLLFKSVLLTTALALPNMIKNQWGRIINVASVSVKEPLSYLALSNSIRSAVVTWAKTLATDVGQHNITVNSVLTGYFDTERIAQLNAKKAEQLQVPEVQVRAEIEARVPLKRIGDPREYGYLVAFLASDRAAYLTGTQIPLDGGLLKSL